MRLLLSDGDVQACGSTGSTGSRGLPAPSQSSPGQKAHELAHLLSHSGCAPAQVVVKELSDKALGHEDVPDGRVGGQSPE